MNSKKIFMEMLPYNITWLGVLILEIIKVHTFWGIIPLFLSMIFTFWIIHKSKNRNERK